MGLPAVEPHPSIVLPSQPSLQPNTACTILLLLLLLLLPQPSRALFEFVCHIGVLIWLVHAEHGVLSRC